MERHWRFWAARGMKLWSEGEEQEKNLLLNIRAKYCFLRANSIC